MKKIILTALILLTTISNAQEKQEVEITNDDAPKLLYVLKAKMGFSQLQLFQHADINGNVIQSDFLLSSRLSNKFRLEYGIGASEFNGNSISNNQLVSVKNEYLKIPVTLMYNEDFNKNVSLIYGIGIYGNYLYKSNIPGYFVGKDAGFNIGASIQFGANFKINNQLDLRIMFESQNDLSKINLTGFNMQKEVKTNLFAFNLVYKL